MLAGGGGDYHHHQGCPDLGMAISPKLSGRVGGVADASVSTGVSAHYWKVRRNERKASILYSLATYGPMTPDKLSDTEDIPVSHAKVYLWRYHKQGLLLKYKDGSFGISGRGHERLWYLS